MLFTSYIYILFFLPLTLLLFFKLAKHYNATVSLFFIVGASLVFYTYWKPEYLLLIILSTVFNYTIGLCIAQKKCWRLNTKQLLIIGIAINCATLGYFKYANFIVDNINVLLSSDIKLNHVILPLAISFFTFQQIAFLVDAYRGEVADWSFIKYCQFVTFFPQLIAGPIVHHKEIVPQLNNPSIYRFNKKHITIGLTLFAIGLFKKIMIADNLAPIANSIFTAAAAGENILFANAWLGALAYTLQLYFDFSGYADMAIGSAKLFGITLPINFDSPYKATNIIDFWRRWHITLSRFLKEYVYIPLGGNRYGLSQRNLNLMITMLLGGLWHGAGWTFIIWGGLHGLYLLANHSFRHFRQHRLGHDLNRTTALGKRVGCIITLLSIIVAWVFFRAESLSTALNLLQCMFSLEGINQLLHSEPTAQLTYSLSFNTIQTTLTHPWVLITSLFAAVVLLPNSNNALRFTQQINQFSCGYWSQLCCRLPAYMLSSYILVISALASIYYTRIDLFLYRALPLRTDVAFVNNKQGDLRSNIYINDVFQGDEKKIILVGSSFTGHSGSFVFEKNNKRYKFGSLGMGGNFINNGIRLAVVAMENSNVDTLILGVSPLNMHPIKPRAPFKHQAVSALNHAGFNFKVNRNFEPTPSGLPLYLHAFIYFNPSHTSFAQIHGLIHNIKSRYDKRLNKRTLPRLSMKKNNIEDFYRHIEILKSTAKNPVKNIDNGAHHRFNWSKRGEFDALRPKGDVYRSIKALKKLCDAKNIRLVIYDTPTPNHSIAPHIYPEGYLEQYRKLMGEMMSELHIEYIDLIDFLPWKGELMFDFIHPTKQTRLALSKHIIYKLFSNDEINLSTS